MENMMLKNALAMTNAENTQLQGALENIQMGKRLRFDPACAFPSRYWTDREHSRFLEAIRIYGKNIPAVAQYVGTRNSTQVRTHLQKYQLKLKREGGSLANATNPDDGDSAFEGSTPRAQPSPTGSSPSARGAQDGQSSQNRQIVTNPTLQVMQSQNGLGLGNNAPGEFRPAPGEFRPGSVPQFAQKAGSNYISDSQMSERPTPRTMDGPFMSKGDPWGDLRVLANVTDTR